MRSWGRPAAAVACLTSAVLTLASCADEAPEGAVARTGDDQRVTSAPPAGDARPAVQALVLAPEGSTHLTVTDFDAVRSRLGVPGLTSEDLMTDRLEFWRRVPASTVLLTDGVLREDNSLFDLRYGFTQDDVDWEAHWTGDGTGFALGLREDLDPDGVHRAVADEVPALAGAEVLDPYSTVLGGEAAGAVSWAHDPGLLALADVDAESLLLRRGCVPFLDALGVDATTEHLDPLLSRHEVEQLLEVQAVALAFTGTGATVRLLYPEGTDGAAIEADLHARVALAEDWPVVESIGFPDGFAADRARVLGATDGVGEVTYPVTNPVAAANLALADLVPLGVCTDPGDLAEPTGL